MKVTPDVSNLSRLMFAPPTGNCQEETHEGISESRGSTGTTNSGFVLGELTFSVQECG
jgi:hypothetical protein